MDESEAIKYMVSTEGWEIIQRGLDSKVQFHKDQLVNCPLDKVEYHRTMIEAMQYIPSVIAEKIEAV